MRWWSWLLLAPLILGLIVFVAFDPLVEWRTREALEQLKRSGYVATFEDASLQPRPLSYGLKRLTITREGQADPIFFAEKIQLDPQWRQLLKGTLVAKARVEGAKLHLTRERRGRRQPLPDLAQQLERLAPMQINQLVFEDSQVVFLDKTRRDLPRMRLSKLEGTLENLATRRALATKKTTVELSARLEDEGHISLSVEAEPFADGLFFSGSFEVTQLQLEQFHALIAAKSGVALEHGTADVSARFRCRNGSVTGQVNATIRNPELAVGGAPGVADALTSILSGTPLGDLPGQLARPGTVHVVVPLDFDLKDPHLSLGPAIASVLRDALVKGIAESYRRMGVGGGLRREGMFPELLDLFERPQ